MGKKNIISLGFFCSIAEELERMGFRSRSSPFDWLISDFEGVLKLLDNNFEYFLEYELLYQKVDQKAVYKNIKYDISFYHDFNKFKPLIDQLAVVQEKYSRRIEQFYKDIKQPTIFLRYIKDQKELDYIEENYSYISKIITKYNESNEIFFISNEELISKNITPFNVNTDSDDSVARKPFIQIPELVLYLEKNFDIQLRERNIRNFKNKKNKRISILKKIISKIKTPYKHINIYSE